jgi:hypothetical protein
MHLPRFAVSAEAMRILVPSAAAARFHSLLPLLDLPLVLVAVAVAVQALEFSVYTLTTKGSVRC